MIGPAEELAVVRKHVGNRRKHYPVLNRERPAEPCPRDEEEHREQDQENRRENSDFLVMLADVPRLENGAVGSQWHTAGELVTGHKRAVAENEVVQRAIGQQKRGPADREQPGAREDEPCAAEILREPSAVVTVVELEDQYDEQVHRHRPQRFRRNDRLEEEKRREGERSPDGRTV